MAKYTSTHVCVLHDFYLPTLYRKPTVLSTVPIGNISDMILRTKEVGNKSEFVLETQMLQKCDVDAVLYLDSTVVFFGRMTAHASGVAAARAALHLHARRPY